MDIVSSFSSKDLAGKILLLDEIEREKRTDAIPALFELYSAPKLDDTLRYALGDTLRALLSTAETETVEGLRSPNLAVRKLCTQISGQRLWASALPELLRTAAAETEPDALFQVLSTLALFRAPAAIELYRSKLSHPDGMIAALAIETVGVYRDVLSFETLCRIISEAESEGRYESCDMTTEKAIVALSQLGTDEALSFLTSKTHHKNPTARRLIHREIVSFGARAIPVLAALFERGNDDEKTLVTNLLGALGDRKGGDFLVGAFDRKAGLHPNIRFAIYEALGQIQCLKGLVSLSDGLLETDDMLLLAVVTSLDHLLNPGILARMASLLKAGNEHSQKLAQAIVSAKALHCFESLYEDPSLGGMLVDRISGAHDAELLTVFRDKLGTMAGERAEADAKRLSDLSVSDKAKRLLAVDDSKSMLLFYKSVGAAAGLEVTTATNGKEAMAHIDLGESFDLIITDMNMPVMDGIEFTRKVRSNMFFETIPILLATTESEASQKEIAAKAGVTGFLTKPLRPDTLREAIAQYLP